MTFNSNTRSSLRRVLLATVLGVVGLMAVAATAGAEHVYYDAPPQTNIDRSRPDEYSKTARYIACLAPNTNYSFDFSAKTSIRDGFEGPGEFRTTTTGSPLTGVSVTPASFKRLVDNMNINAVIRFTTGPSTEIPSEISVRLVLLTPTGFDNPDSRLRLIIPRICPTPPPPPTTTTAPTVTTETIPTVTTDTVPTVTTETEPTVTTETNPTVTTEGTISTATTTPEPPASVKVAGDPVPVTTAATPATTAASTICKASSRSVKVRGKRATTISVKLDKPNQTVKISGAGINKTLKSGKNGTAVLKVTPRRSGTVRATGDQCALVLNAAVKTKKITPRKTERRITPRFTG